MEVMTRRNIQTDLELDNELDMVGIILDRPLICGNCLKQMQQVGRGMYSCPSCQKTYEGI
ncbi:MAG: hypothetical protein ABIF10_06500 [Candidatus Woesearchaeota archaeon]